MLSYILQTRQKNIETLIELHREQINQETWLQYIQLTSSPINTPLQHIANESQINEEDREEAKKALQKFTELESYLAIDLATDHISNPTSFAYTYITYLKEITPSS